MGQISPRAGSVSIVARSYCARIRKLAEIGHVKSKWVRDACRYLDRFAALFPDLAAESCTNDHVLIFLAAHPEWRSGCTKNNVVKAILGAWKLAYEEGVIRKVQINRRGLKLPPERPRAALREKDYRRWQGHKPGLIFTNQRGKPWKYFHELFLTHARRAGISAGRTAYSLRHGWISDAVEAGVNDRAIADVVGHKGTQRVDSSGRVLATRFISLRGGGR